MRRFAVLVAMLVPLSLFAAGCGGGGARTSPDSSRKTEAEKAEKLKQQMEEMQSKKLGKMMSKQNKDAGLPDKTPTPEK